ncbi:GNAT family N-acetyltransferase [Enterococcus sp. BWR-S5]|uniref:GNAT family N-acetyltransferase n=1 Tax=Enterococcus sp. BWR-S5 TaxID=2787714 RepID=UPI001922162F|nr:GNAT family N-acetyltransferase [Enterococcus sp. BWR-S5]MBL1224488.1 GNAT family N-acetyltransferase [Enterococcus sp. BWR-S5]
MRYNKKDGIELSIRAVVAEELPQLQKMYQEAFRGLLKKYQDNETNPATVTMKQLEKLHASPTDEQLFILVDGKAVGSIKLSHLPNETIKLGPIAVLPTYQKQGIGKAAMAQIEEKYPACRRWLLDTIKQEVYLVNFYKSLGYVPTGKTEKVQSNMTIIFFQKEVS